MTKQLTTQNATITTAAAEVKTLAISGKRAAAVIGGTQSAPWWPYGVGVVSRQRYDTDEDYQQHVDERHAMQLVLVEWAERNGLKQARRDACCMAWLLRDRTRVCTRPCRRVQRLYIDHMTSWARDGVPAVVVNTPYNVGSMTETLTDYAKRMTAVDERLRAAWTDQPGWYGRPSGIPTGQVFLWRSDVIDHVEFARAAPTCAPTAS